MLRLDTFLKRLRSASSVKPREHVQTVNGSETMTRTQAYRFRELQSIRFEGKAGRQKTGPHYSLKEAARLIRSEVDDILSAAAAGRLQCFVESADLQGHWLTTGPAGLPVAMPGYLALSPADCRQIADYGGVNVSDLEYHPATSNDGDPASPAMRFVLREPMWVDRAHIVLKHPLPK